MSTARTRGLALVGCLILGCRGRASPDPLVHPEPTVQVEQRTMTSSPPATTLDALISEAAARVRAGLPASGPYSVLLSVGAGEPSASAAAGLRRELASEPRIVFASVTSEHVAPVADGGDAGGHVHGVQYNIEPPPQLVLSVSEASGCYYFAARAPGSDPLGPPTNGWSWVVSGPACGGG